MFSFANFIEIPYCSELKNESWFTIPCKLFVLRKHTINQYLIFAESCSTRHEIKWRQAAIIKPPIFYEEEIQRETLSYTV